MTRLGLVAALAGLLSACGTLGAESDCDDKCDALTNATILSTRNQEVTRLRGYNPLFDRVTPGSCVVESEASTARPRAIDSNMTIEYVESRSELARALGVELDLAVRYSALGEGSLEMKIVDEYKHGDHVVNLLVKSERHFELSSTDSPTALNDRGRDALSRGPSEFERQCGTHFVSSVRRGASLYVLISIATDSAETARKIQGSLGAETLVVDAEVTAQIEQSSKQEDISVSIELATAGFVASTSLAELSQAGLDAGLFEHVTALERELDEAFAAELGALDTGMPATMPVTGARVGFYHQLDELSARDVDDIARLQTRLRGVTGYLADYGELLERTQQVFYGEVAPAVQADDPARYQIHPATGDVHSWTINDTPFQPGMRSRASAVLEHLTAPLDAASCSLEGVDCSWFERLHPATSGQVGEQADQLLRRINRCWNAAAIDLFSDDCIDSDTEVRAEANRSALSEAMEIGGSSPRGEFSDHTSRTEWGLIESVLTQYGQTARVLPLPVQLGAAAEGDDAADVCSEEHPGTHVPAVDADDWTLDGGIPRVVGGEAGYVSAFVRDGQIDWPSHAPHEVWVRIGRTADDAHHFCRVQLGLDGAYWPVLIADPTEAFPRLSCRKDEYFGGDGDDVVTLCLGAPPRRSGT